MGPGRLCLGRQGNVRKNTAVTHFPRSMHALLSSAFLIGQALLTNSGAISRLVPPLLTTDGCDPVILCQGGLSYQAQSLSTRKLAHHQEQINAQARKPIDLLKPKADLTSVDGGGAWGRVTLQPSLECGPHHTELSPHFTIFLSTPRPAIILADSIVQS